MANNKKKEFQVYAKLNLDVSIPVTANSMEEALEIAKKLQETDFVKINGEFCDGSLEISGIYKS